jgi:hypothetical protein
MNNEIVSAGIPTTIANSHVDYQYGVLVMDSTRPVGYVVVHDVTGFRMAKPGEAPSIWSEHDEAVHTANRVIEIYEKLGLEKVLASLSVKVQKRAVITCIGAWED